jgi:hypothetical protein
MKSEEIMDKERKRVCCNCGRNKRIKENDGNINCYCEIDNHRIGYLENFSDWCRRWTKERKWDE